MTNKEYLTTVLSRFGATVSDIDLIMLEQGINADEDVNGTEGVKTLKKAIYTQLPQMFAGLQNISEGGYSIHWNMEALKLWYSSLAVELGLPNILNPAPEVTGMSPW